MLDNPKGLTPQLQQFTPRQHSVHREGADAPWCAALCHVSAREGQSDCQFGLHAPNPIVTRQHWERHFVLGFFQTYLCTLLHASTPIGHQNPDPGCNQA